MYRSSSSVGVLIAVWLVIIGLALIVGTFLTQIVWAWVIPDIFAGAVHQGILPATLSLWQAFKLGIFLVLMLGSGVRGSSSRK